MRRIPAELTIALVAAILFIPFLGATHLFDWDEINFAESSREMLATGNYAIPQINYVAYWEKPPLFFWLQALSMMVFGVNEFAARFPNAVCGILTLILLFRIGKKQVDEKFGWIWALVYAGSLLPQFYFKSGIIDPWFNLFIFLSVYQLSLYTDATIIRKTKPVLLAGFFAGLAMMTKGPVALLVIGLCYGVFALTSRFRNFMKPVHILLFLLLASLVGSIWFLALLANGKQQIIIEFINYQVRLFQTEDAGHGGPFFYHFIVLLIGCFPAAALSLLSMKRLSRNDYEVPKHVHKWMQILFWVVLLLFSIVKTKIVHYSSLCYFPLTFLASVSFYFLYKRKWHLPGWNKWLQFGTGLLLALLIIGVTFIDQLKPWLLTQIKDDASKAAMQANVHWSGWEKLPGILLILGLFYYLFTVRKNIRLALPALFVLSMLAINLTIVFITPKVEPYSQGAHIEFLESKQKERAIVETSHFFSYAQLFYAQRPPDLGKPVVDSILKYNTHPDVKVYYVGKLQDEATIEQEIPNLQKLYAKNGFVFWQLKRSPLSP